MTLYLFIGHSALLHNCPLFPKILVVFLSSPKFAV